MTNGQIEAVGGVGDIARAAYQSGFSDGYEAARMVIEVMAQDERARGVVPDAVEALARLDALLSGLAEHEARFPVALATACGLPPSYPDEYKRAQEAAARRREVA